MYLPGRKADYSIRIPTGKENLSLLRKRNRRIHSFSQANREKIGNNCALHKQSLFSTATSQKNAECPENIVDTPEATV
jgi:hypothetical protein